MGLYRHWWVFTGIGGSLYRDWYVSLQALVGLFTGISMSLGCDGLLVAAFMSVTNNKYTNRIRYKMIKFEHNANTETPKHTCFRKTKECVQV